MGKNIIVPEKYRCRGYKLLLYPDNKQHMDVLKRLRRHSEYSKRYVGIWHIQHDQDGNVIEKGEGKKHAHIIVNHENPVYWRAFNSELGFSSESDGQKVIDYRFCMPVSVNIDSTGQFVKNGRASVERGLVYLTHADSPDKEQYTCCDLWGAPDMIEQAMKATDAYLMRNLSMSECVFMICEWINDQKKYIHWNEFVLWLCGTPYFKGQSSPIVRQVFDEHNRKWLKIQSANADAFTRSEQFEQMTGTPRFGIVNSGCQVYRFEDFKPIDELQDGGIMI